ncbi:MAG: DUF4340 domain-containing protein [Desulfobacterales bacterium]|nr:DUF4340 domain-containing protein [Desulfobacterales bacterium]
MKLKTFAILLITFCILLAVVLLTTRTKKTAEDQADMGAKLFAGLAAGNIAAITITSPEATAKLKQTPNGWIVENRFGYPADFSKVAELVKKLSDAKIGRTFPASAEIQARQSLYPPEQQELPADQKGTRIVLADKDAKTLADLIIGKERENGGDTFYVMPLPQSRICLIDQNFRFLEKKPADWLNKKPLDLNPKKVQKVVLFDPKKNRAIYTLQRPAEDKDPVLLDLAPDKKMAKFKADQLFEALTSLTVEDVADPGQKDAARFSGAPRFDYTLYDGTVYHVFPGAALKEDAEKHYFRTEVSYQPPPGKADPAQKESQAKLKEEAEKLNLKISPLTYVISKWVYDSFFTDPKNLIEKEAKK